MIAPAPSATEHNGPSGEYPELNVELDVVGGDPVQYQVYPSILGFVTGWPRQLAVEIARMAIR